MAAAVFAVAATVGAEMIGVAMGKVTLYIALLGAKAAYSDSGTIIGEDAHQPSQQIPPSSHPDSR